MSYRPQLPDETIVAIGDQYLRGASVAMIAAQFGVSNRSVYRFLKKLNITHPTSASLPVRRPLWVIQHIPTGICYGPLRTASKALEQIEDFDVSQFAVLCVISPRTFQKDVKAHNDEVERIRAEEEAYLAVIDAKMTTITRDIQKLAAEQEEVVNTDSEAFDPQAAVRALFSQD